MASQQEFPLRIQKFDIAVSLVCCLLLGFFGWHASKGPRGFSYADTLAAESARLTGQLAAATEHRQGIESRVVLLRPESIDPDMLDEVSRRSLLLVRANEIVVPVDR
jgi:cell division protein FtsB